MIHQVVAVGFATQIVLQEKVDMSDVDRRDHVVEISVGRDDDPARVGMRLGDLLEKVNSVHPLHSVVAQNDSDLILFGENLERALG